MAGYIPPGPAAFDSVPTSTGTAGPALFSQQQGPSDFADSGGSTGTFTRDFSFNTGHIVGSLTFEDTFSENTGNNLVVDSITVTNNETGNSVSLDASWSTEESENSKKFTLTSPLGDLDPLTDFTVTTTCTTTNSFMNIKLDTGIIKPELRKHSHPI